MLPALAPPYGLVFCDGDPDAYPGDFDHVVRLLAPGGLLVTSNLFLGVHVPDAPYLAQAAAYRERLLSDPALETAILPGGLALSVKARSP